MEILALATLFLISAVVIVPIFHKLNLGAVLGYLIAGMLIGPSGLHLIGNTESILEFSEFGVIFLMFVIGLELQPSRLWVLRRAVFGLGTAQVLVTSGLIFGLGLLGGLGWKASLVLGWGLSMSSTALVLQSLAEKNQLASQHGRDAFAVLLFQDLAVIPILALLPLLGAHHDEMNFTWQEVVIPMATILGLVVIGRWILRPAFKWIAGIENRDLLSAASLLVVIGSAGIMQSVGLSMGLGAFLAGVLLSDSEFRHELEANIEPFKGLLLGLFFISIGMTAKIELIWENPLRILGLVLLLYFVKSLAVFLIKTMVRAHRSVTRKLAIYLSQGGEFAFVLFSAAVALKIFDRPTEQLFVIVVTVSMLLAPFLFLLEEKIFAKKLDQEPELPFDTNFDESQVIIAGFGRFGQIVGRLLALRKIKFTALDKSSTHVDFIRRFGNKIFYGDASRLDVLISAKVGSAKLFVLAIDNIEDSLKTAEMVRRHFPNLPIYARARNRFHTYKLLDLGVTSFYRETWFSSLEMGKSVLQFLGLQEENVKKMIEKFQVYDEEILRRQHAVYQNEKLLIETSKQAASDLENLFENDARVPLNEKN